MDLDELLDLTSNETANTNIKLSVPENSHEDFRGSETKQNIEKYAKRLLNLEQQKKIIQEDIKEIGRAHV